jgi:hypothetical protein
MLIAKKVSLQLIPAMALISLSLNAYANSSAGNYAECPAYAQQASASDWKEVNVNRKAHNPLGEVRWVPEFRTNYIGHIECSYQAAHPRIATPTLISKFYAYRPTQIGWEYPGPNYTWLLCSGATMQEFDASKCQYIKTP